MILPTFTTSQISRIFTQALSQPMLDNEQSNPTSTATNAVTKDSNSTPVYQQIQSIIADDFEIMDKQVYGSLSSKSNWSCR